jgi:hypothetical protein
MTPAERRALEQALDRRVSRSRLPGMRALFDELLSTIDARTTCASIEEIASVVTTLATVIDDAKEQAFDTALASHVARGLAAELGAIADAGGSA